MSRRWIERIKDILNAIEEIQTFTQGMDEQAFAADQRTIRAIELGFIIIGEAASAVPEEVSNIYPQIPWHLMRAMRNRLVHVYFEVAPGILWQTIQRDLPPLRALLAELLENADKS